MITVDVRKAIADIQTVYRDRLSENEWALAIARAINRTATAAKAESSRQIRAVYKIKAKDVSKAIDIKRATKVTKTGYVIASGRPLPLIAFTPRQTKQGVSVTIVNTRKTVKRAFIANLKSGHKGVFARGEYGQGQFAFGTKRLPITELTTVSVPTAFINETVNTAITDKINTLFPQRLQHEVEYILSKAAQ